MKIDSLMYAPGPSSYYTEELRVAIRDQLPLLRVAPSTQIINVDPMDRIKFKGDLYGLFAKMNVPAHLWWPVQMLSGINDRFTVSDKLEQILIPDQNFLDRLAQGITTGKRVN